jgi:hypothetical protein
MTPQQQRKRELANITKSIALFEGIIKRSTRLIPKLSPADAQLTRFEILNDRFMIKRLRAEYKALINSPL